ncbi:helix-turn-helix transcriptional regulator [Lacticaseibacillus rhamnosus]|uniref:helix-turn-helix domain-containing protein n=1 Tax=Lacticaseibacillus TaxID=2759736 RepID=UPI0022DEC465|nr:MULTISPECIES: helix-turn-helix transcriptional regulator [Lacticaseibacillus]MDT8864138.1 helix-turn-helix transcriptional regulator [Lacticaseibacillus rhamnosus]WLV86330.1 helix-turn-helix transcriptional regulator [Lacticaseibacillus sp. NCIMB 15474]
MLMSNLAILLAERKLRISRTATDTGISRTTLTALSQNDFKGIQVDTMNTLCQYLAVTPGELFDFVPFDLTFSIDQEGIRSSGLGEKGDLIDKVIIQKSDMDAFLKRSSINEAVGRNEKTFDLTVRITDDVTIPTKGGSTFDSSVTDNEPVNIPIEVLLGHSDDTKTFESEHDGFNKMWMDELTPAFRAQISNSICRIIKNTISTNVREFFYKFISVNLYNPDWDRLKYVFSVSFNDAYTKEKNGDLSLKIKVDKLPF